jgi:hypothetical protein
MYSLYFLLCLNPLYLYKGKGGLFMIILNVGNIKFGLGDPDFVLKQDIYYV